MKDILITGVHGQLGRAVRRICQRRGLDVDGVDVDTLDITDRDPVTAWIGEHRPRFVINCAAYTAVDDCESDEAAALRINSDAVGHLADACTGLGATLIHVSTDYVFDGRGDRPYREDDPTGPRSAYGRTKLAGEQRAARCPDHVIARTAWLYGIGGRNFVEAIRSQIEAGRDSLRVVADQFGNPTFCDDLAEALLDLAGAGARGVFHCVNSGATSWHGFAAEIVRLLGADTEVLEVGTEAYPRPAPRPAYSVLDTTRLETTLGRSQSDWRHALARYLDAT